MEVEDLLGLRENGAPIGNTTGLAGRVVVVNAQPLLECVHGVSGQPELLLHARPGWVCAIEERRAVGPGEAWQELLRAGTANLTTVYPLGATNWGAFYRAVRLPSASR